MYQGVVFVPFLLNGSNWEFVMEVGDFYELYDVGCKWDEKGAGGGLLVGAPMTQRILALNMPCMCKGHGCMCILITIHGL